MFKRTESGRSMIEMLGVLAIIGILSAGGIAGYTMAMKNYRANKALETLQLTSTQIITAYAGNDDYSSLTAENLPKLKVDLTSPYGTDLTAEGSEGSFKLIMEGVPGQACLKIAQAPWGDQYLVGDSENSSRFTINPFDCDDENTNTIVFTYLSSASSSSSDDSSACNNDGYEACMSENDCANQSGSAADDCKKACVIQYLSGC